MAKVNQWRAGQLDSSFDMIQNMQFFIQNLHKMCTQNWTTMTNVIQYK